MSQNDKLFILTNGLITLYAIFFILNIYWLYNVKKKNNSIIGKKDYGLIWLSVGFLLWLLTGIVFYTSHNDYLVSFLSLANNGIFICSFTFFDHGIDWLTKQVHRKKFFLITAIVTALLIFINLTLLGTGNTSLKNYSNYIEAAYTGIMLVIFAGILFNSFFVRKLYGIAFAAISVVCLVFFTQSSMMIDLNGNNTVMNGVNIASHALLLMVVVSLSFSWIIEKIEEKIDYDDSVRGKSIVEKFTDDSAGFVNYLKDRISNYENEFTLLILKEYYKKKLDKNNLNTVILRLSDYNRIQSLLRNGIVEKNEADRQIREISNVLLELIDKIKVSNDKIKKAGANNSGC